MSKFYVTLTWHGWPEGGSYGTVVEAKDHAAAEVAAREEMAGVLAEEHGLCWHCGEDAGFGGDGWDGLCASCADQAETEDLEPTEAAVEKTLKDYGPEWYLVDCINIPEILKEWSTL